MIKKLSICLLGICLFASSASYAADYKTVKVSADVLNVRSGTSIEADIIGKIENSKEICVINEIEENELKWYEINFEKDKKAYISAEYTSDLNDGFYGVVIDNNCNIRKEANLKSEVLYKANMSDKVYIYEKEGDFYKIKYKDTKAYIFSELVSLDKTYIVGSAVATRGEFRNDSSKIISVAKSKIGVPYVYGANGPNSYDCSSYTKYVFKKALNVNIPRTSLEQSKTGTKISKENLQPGDLVFFDTSKKGRVNHVGIYLGQGKFIHESSGSAKSVTISDLSTGFYKRVYKWARRIK
ncbi:NlpC/P60 family protein [Peptostreptococcaceae bacterium AGR-M142]